MVMVSFFIFETFAPKGYDWTPTHEIEAEVCAAVVAEIQVMLVEFWKNETLRCSPSEKTKSCLQEGYVHVAVSVAEVDPLANVEVVSVSVCGPMVVIVVWASLSKYFWIR